MAKVMKSADIALIKRIIPHRYPFLYVDKVVDIDGTNSALGIKNVTINEPFFQGHFPEEPVMPGVLILEAMAQTCGVMISVSRDYVDTGVRVYLMSIDNAKFRRKVVPGDRLELYVETIRGHDKKVVKLACTGTVDGEMAATAEIMAMISHPEDQ